MVDQLTFARENRERIQAVESSFGPSGKPLSRPDRVLIGEGRLLKLSRRGPQPKVFFLFNDVLVYGSIILNGRWHKNQQIIPLEDLQLEDLEDGATMRNQWLIRTPRKSFYVSATSSEEKKAWMEHMEECQSRLLQSGGRKPSSAFAVTWIPDQSSAVCMRCAKSFSVTLRRHHCRKCGFVVCSLCSKKRAVLPHIHATKQVRVCIRCHPGLGGGARVRGDSTGMKTGLDEDDLEMSSVEEVVEVEHHPSRWMDPFSTYVYLNPDHVRP